MHIPAVLKFVYLVEILDFEDFERYVTSLIVI